MAEMKLDLDLSGVVREGMIETLTQTVSGFTQFRMAVILRLLRDDPIARCMIAEAMGEKALKEKAADDAAQAELHRTNFLSDGPEEKSWDEIMLEVITELEDTPGGRGEVG